MERTSFEDWNCSAARALEIVGDWWTMMIVRECFYGSRRFSEFQVRLGISKNILTRRLMKMEKNGLLERCAVDGNARANDYLLTEKGRSLFTVLIALMQWGDRWEDRGDGPPVELIRRSSKVALGPLKVRDIHGEFVRPSELVPRPGAGADEETTERFGGNRQTKQA